MQGANSAHSAVSHHSLPDLDGRCTLEVKRWKCAVFLHNHDGHVVGKLPAVTDRMYNAKALEYLAIATGLFFRRAIRSKKVKPGRRKLSCPSRAATYSLILT